MSIMSTEMEVELPNGDLSSSKILLENLPVLLAGIWTKNDYSQLKATSILRSLVTTGYKPHTDGVIQLDLVPRLIKFLSRYDFPKLQYEAAWALKDIASGTSENKKVIVESGAVPKFIQLLGSANEDLLELAVWAIGNIARDSPKYRDLVLNSNAMKPILSQFHDHTTLSMSRIASSTLANLCSGKPKPSFKKTKPALPVLERLVQSTDEEVLKNACWTLAYLYYDDSNDQIHAVTDARVIPRLIELLSHSSPSVLFPALCTIGNIVSGNDKQTQTVLDHQVLPCLLNLLTNTYEMKIKKEACWTISNITAGSSNQIQAVIKAGIIQPLVLMLQTAEFEVQKEAAWGISNATDGTHDQIKFMVSQNCIKSICDLLTCPDPKIITVCLEALENILVVGEAEKNLSHTRDDNLYASMIDEAQGLEKIVNLQRHDNNEISLKAAKILETFWTEDNIEEGNDENLAPLGFVLV